MTETSHERAGRAAKAQEAVSAPVAGPPASRLTGYDRQTIAQARVLAAPELDAAAVRELTGDQDNAMAFAVAFGRAQFHLRDLLAIIARLTGEAGDG